MPRRNPNKPPRLCVTCSAPIEHSGKYCSRVCDPKKETHCIACGTLLVNRDQFKFCSRSCSAATNNVLYQKRQVEGQCFTCGNPCPSKRKWCDSCYQTHYKYRAASSKRKVPCVYIGYNQHRIAEWLTGEWDGSQKSGASNAVRAYLLDINDYKCSMCGFDTPHPVDNTTILEIDHIDGDSTNNTFTNLRVLCPNCHALTPSYRARNTGKCTRTTHYVRVNKSTP